MRGVVSADAWHGGEGRGGVPAPGPVVPRGGGPRDVFFAQPAAQGLARATGRDGRGAVVGGAEPPPDQGGTGIGPLRTLAVGGVAPPRGAGDVRVRFCRRLLVIKRGDATTGRLACPGPAARSNTCPLAGRDGARSAREDSTPVPRQSDGQRRIRANGVIRVYHPYPNRATPSALRPASFHSPVAKASSPFF